MSFVDELVLLGNHRDAWVFGAADASSGTAAMMELSRVLGKQLEKGTSQLKVESCTSTEVRKEIVIHFPVANPDLLLKTCTVLIMLRTQKRLALQI